MTTTIWEKDKLLGEKVEELIPLLTGYREMHNWRRKYYELDEQVRDLIDQLRRFDFTYIGSHDYVEYEVAEAINDLEDYFKGPKERD